MTGPSFGLNVGAPPGPGVDPVADAVRAEGLGFDFVSVSDHLHGDSPTYEPWTLLTWIAAATTRIQVASRVLAVPYRNPAVLAKMAETLGRLSGGRLILGLGGGYVDDEFRAFGIGAPSPRDKIDGLEEAIRIVRGLWTESSLTFEGRLYRTDGATLRPRPEHRVPIWLGTYKPRGLALTGRLADGWIPSLGFVPPDQITSLRDRVIVAARDAGRDPDEITSVYNIVVRVDDRAQPDTGIVAGSPAAIAERLIGFLGLGFSAFNFMLDGPDPAVQAERLAREVIPAVRQGAA